MRGIEAHLRGALGSFSLDVDLALPERGITALFGASGSGKTTVLRCIAGLVRLSGSRLVVNTEVWQDDSTFLPPHRRSVGYVFQEASLFPHLSVRGNLEYGLRRASKDRRFVSFDEVVRMLGLEPLLERSPLRLSGGERQRVAMGRALLAQPRLLLLDEPLSALDRPNRDEILPYLEDLHENLAIPVLYVSHDLGEVERLADHLVLLGGGRVRASGPLVDVLSEPGLPLARLPDASVALEGTVEAFDAPYGLTTLGVDGGTLVVPGRLGGPGTRRRVRIRASDVSLARQRAAETTILNVLPARVIAMEPHDSTQVTVFVQLGSEGRGARLLARVARRSCDALGLSIGEDVYVQIKGAALVDPSSSSVRRPGDCAG